MKEKIDFVMTWVDGGDPLWLEERAKYEPQNKKNIDSRDVRYRDWENIKYWFRGVEKYAPWVNKVYFITFGHIPNWLNLNCPKLIHVKHSDYMPQEYLPTFNSHPIELNIHRIKGLSEYIVYFNDDTFITQPVSPNLFFEKNLPVYLPCLHSITPNGKGGIMPHIYVNNVMCINRNFNMKFSLKQNWRKWFLPSKVGMKAMVENCYNSMYSQFPGFKNIHLPVPFLKSSIQEIWNKEYDLLHVTSIHKFRHIEDVSQYLFRYWQLASGNFIPKNQDKIGRSYDLSNNPNILQICRAITEQKYKMLCINESKEWGTLHEFEKAKQEINEAWQKILPDKSSFEL